MSDTIDCREAADRLQDYLRRELTPELEVEIRAHIERCRPCFSQSRFEENFLAMLESSAPANAAPTSFAAASSTSSGPKPGAADSAPLSPSVRPLPAR